MYYYVSFDWTPLPVGVDRPNRLLRTLRPVLPSSDRNDPKSGRRRALIIDQTSWCLFSAVSKPIFPSEISECFFCSIFQVLQGFLVVSGYDSNFYTVSLCASNVYTVCSSGFSGCFFHLDNQDSNFYTV